MALRDLIPSLGTGSVIPSPLPGLPGLNPADLKASRESGWLPQGLTNAIKPVGDLFAGKPIKDVPGITGGSGGIGLPGLGGGMPGASGDGSESSGDSALLEILMKIIGKGKGS